MIRIFNHFIPKMASALLCIEFLVLMAVTYLGDWVRLSIDSGSAPRDLMEISLSALCFASVMVLSMATFGMYRLDIRDSFRNEFLRVAAAIALGFGAMSLLDHIFPSFHFGGGLRALAIIVAAVSGILILRALIFKSSDLKLLKSRVIFVGGGALAQECGYMVKNSMFMHKYHVVGFVPLSTEETCVSSSAILPSSESLSFMAKKYDANEIVVSVKNLRNGNVPINELLACKLSGIKVTGAATFFEREACQIKVDSLQPSWLVFGDGFNQGMLRLVGKRIFDIAISLTIFVLSLPVMLITALYIYLEDRGPTLYRQERVGKEGNTFMILKFRSMRHNAEQSGKPQWAAINDPRTTRVGSVIRRLRIDELPQVINVLKGEMSFVGPRPERPQFVEELQKSVPYYNARHSIKPGITGFAQVRYPYGASKEDALQKLQYDLYYVKNNSLFLDVLILIDTIQVVLFGRGSR